MLGSISNTRMQTMSEVLHHIVIVRLVISYGTAEISCCNQRPLDDAGTLCPLSNYKGSVSNSGSQKTVPGPFDFTSLIQWRSAKSPPCDFFLYGSLKTKVMDQLKTRLQEIAAVL